ncbi:MAG TPA: hypothetical protein VK504_30675 [Vicinamibacterales bacterium]|nr:hypothetical protein [Vicinamibacterales bacterium]
MQATSVVVVFAGNVKSGGPLYVVALITGAIAASNVNISAK